MSSPGNKPTGSESLVSVFARWATTRGVENSSVKQYRSILARSVEPFFGSRSIGSVTRSDIEEWTSWLSVDRAYKPSTTRFRFNLLMSVFTWAVDGGLTGANPCRGVRLPDSRARVYRDQRAEVHIPSTEAVHAVISAAPERYRGMFWLMAGCGLRLGEAMGIGGDRIDFARQVIRIDRQVACDGDTGTGKYGRMRLRHIKWREEGDRGREAPLPDVVALAMRRQLKEHGTWGPDDLLFSNVTGTGLLYPSYWYAKIWKPALATAGLDYFKPHSFRHFYAASLFAARVPVTEVSAWLGHSSVSFTEKYYNDLMPDAPDRARLAIDGVLGLATPVASARPARLHGVA
ncbi:tyrosine-type recombinase/integrase [Streptomyces sp. NPDC021093]|uniref:tyrosine-type recombinase/integrase n=1 Tax=Streptomyces sp. NPDC021093 TaxID=3365112 RepID=UPI0037983D94